MIYGKYHIGKYHIWPLYCISLDTYNLCSMLPESCYQVIARTLFILCR